MAGYKKKIQKKKEAKKIKIDCELKVINQLHVPIKALQGSLTRGSLYISSSRD